MILVFPLYKFLQIKGKKTNLDHIYYFSFTPKIFWKSHQCYYKEFYIVLYIL
jgi:hypothetical protein